MSTQDSRVQAHERNVEGIRNTNQRILQTVCFRDRFAPASERLLAQFALLANEYRDAPDLTDNSKRPDALCISALQPAFREQPQAAVERLIDAQVLDHLDDVWIAIDTIGHAHWLPVLTCLVSDQRITPAVRWQIAARFASHLPAPEATLPDTWADWQPGQLSVALRQQTLSPEDAFKQVQNHLDSPQHQADFYWLALVLKKQQSDQILPLFILWLGAAPDSPYLHRAIVASGMDGFVEELHQWVRSEQIPALALALHGHPSHIGFCLELLDEPRFNLAAAELWAHLTGQKLRQIPRLKSINAVNASGKGRMADPRQVAATDTKQALLSGRPFSAKALRHWCLFHYGQHTEYALGALWALSSVDFPILPNENPWQRRDALRNLNL